MDRAKQERARVREEKAKAKAAEAAARKAAREKAAADKKKIKEAEKMAKQREREAKAASKKDLLKEKIGTITRMWETMGKPGTAALWAAVKREGVPILKREVDKIVKSAAKEVFKPPPKSQGRFTASDVNDKWQMDLAEMRNHAGTNKNFALCVVDVYSRKLWTRAIRNKTPDEVKKALVRIKDQAEGWPRTIVCDKGNEFKGEVIKYLKLMKVSLTNKDPADKNGLAVVDRAIQTLKVRLAERMAEDQDGAWSKHIEQVTRSMNATPKPGVLHGAAPNDVQDDPKLQFMLNQDNAKKMQHNIKLQQKRGEATKDRQFRTQVKNNFDRAYNPNWSSTTLTASKVQGSTVTATDGSTHALKAIRVVPFGAEAEVKPRFAQSRLHQVKEVVAALQDVLKNRAPMSVSDAGKLMETRLPTTKKRLTMANMTLRQVVLESPLFKKVGTKITLA